MFRAVCMALVALFGLSGASLAQSGKPGTILTVEGKIEGGTAIGFTLADLEALGTATIRTSTPWHDGVQEFEGVPISRLMEKVGATGDLLYVEALNEYSSEVPVSDLEEYGVILAYKQNGKYMEVADKGPLFIIYPFDENKEINSELYYTRSVWQVKKISVE